MKKIKVFTLIIVLLSLHNAFSQQAAKDFVMRQFDTATCDKVYLIVTDRVLYANESLNLIENFNDLDSSTQANLLKEYQIIGKKPLDSILIATFKNELISKLQYLGIKVIQTPADSLPDSLDARSHTLNIKQLEIEEFIAEDSISYYENDTAKYVYRKALNGVRFNAWFFYNEKDTANSLTLFCNEAITDDFQGNITMGKGNKPVVSYSLTRINPNDTYVIAKETGRESAICFFNLLLNKYVFNKTDGEDRHYYGIDLKSGNILMDNEPFDNFDVLETEQ
ncbi:MAG: hypothetical protein LBR17_02700 [Bacteroidales bacterium]|jgi:hypothetical protein|nr:hypothetical protein [Bacteroidales bacterium]